MPHMDSDDDMLTHYSRALDEIYRLRRALAYEARVVEGVLEMYASLPKTVRPKLAGTVERLRASARGNAQMVYADVPANRWRGLLGAADAAETLTRGQWEADRG